MKVTSLALFALLGVIGVAFGMGYGYGGYQYVPVSPGYGSRPGGFGQNGSFLMLIGFLFIFLILFRNNGVNNFTGTGTFG